MVIGSIAGVALIAGLILLFLRWRRNRDDDDDEDFFDTGRNKEQGFDSVTPNPLMSRGAGVAGVGAAGAHMHNNSSTTRSYSTNDDGLDHNGLDHDFLLPPLDEEYGRRRLSNGSLPDMADRMADRRSQPLKVVNY